MLHCSAGKSKDWLQITQGKGDAPAIPGRAILFVLNKFAYNFAIKLAERAILMQPAYNFIAILKTEYSLTSGEGWAFTFLAHILKELLSLSIWVQLKVSWYRLAS